MNLYDIIFWFFIVTSVVSAIALLFSKNVFYAALLMIVILLCIAGIYVLSFAEFIAVTQILVYAGGILVVILFGIMLTARLSDKPVQVQHANVFSGSILALAIFGVLAYFLADTTSLPPLTKPMSVNKQVEHIGMSLMTDYVLVFEISGVLLLISLIGAAIIASTKSFERL